MNADQQAALRQQHAAPDLSTVSVEVAEYIQRLEQGIVDLAGVRVEYAESAWDYAQMLTKITIAIKKLNLPPPGTEHATEKEAAYATCLGTIERDIARLLNWPPFDTEAEITLELTSDLDASIEQARAANKAAGVASVSIEGEKWISDAIVGTSIQVPRSWADGVIHLPFKPSDDDKDETAE